MSCLGPNSLSRFHKGAVSAVRTLLKSCRRWRRRQGRTPIADQLRPADKEQAHGTVDKLRKRSPTITFLRHGEGAPRTARRDSAGNVAVNARATCFVGHATGWGHRPSTGDVSLHNCGFGHTGGASPERDTIHSHAQVFCQVCAGLWWLRKCLFALTKALQSGVLVWCLRRVICRACSWMAGVSGRALLGDAL